jgi:hypothetical protein
LRCFFSHNYCLILILLDNKLPLSFGGLLRTFKISSQVAFKLVPTTIKSDIGAPLESKAFDIDVAKLFKPVTKDDSCCIKFSPNIADCKLVPSTPSDAPKYTLSAVKAICDASIPTVSLEDNCIDLLAKAIIESVLALNTNLPEFRTI